MEKDNREKENNISKSGIILRVLNIVFCLGFILAIIFYVHLGKIISPLLNPDTLKQKINESTGLVLNLEKPQISTTHDFCLNIKSDLIELDTPDNNSKLLSVKNADIKIKIIPLVFKEIEFRKIQSSDFMLDIKRDKDGVFNFQKYFKSGSEFPFKFAAKSALVLIDKYSIFFVDDIHRSSAEIMGGSLVSTEFNLDSYADIETKGILTVKNKGKSQVSPYALDVKLKFPLNKNLDFKDYRLSMSVSDIDFSMLHPYIMEFFSKDIRQFKGKGSLIIIPANTTDIAQNPLSFNLSIENLLIEIFKNNHNNFIDIKGKSTVSLITSFKKDEIFIDKLKFAKPNIDIEAYGTLKNISKFNNINPDITFIIKNSSLNELLKAAPDYLIKMQQDYIPNLKKYNANCV